MSIKLLDLNSTIKFIPESLDNAKDEKPLVIYLKTLDWFESLEASELVTIVQGEGDKQIIDINTDDRAKWFEFVTEKIAKIDNGGEELPVTIETIRALPKLIGLELVKKIISLSQGLEEAQEKK